MALLSKTQLIGPSTRPMKGAGTTGPSNHRLTVTIGELRMAAARTATGASICGQPPSHSRSNANQGTVLMTAAVSITVSPARTAVTRAPSVDVMTCAGALT